MQPAVVDPFVPVSGSLLQRRRLYTAPAPHRPVARRPIRPALHRRAPVVDSVIAAQPPAKTETVWQANLAPIESPVIAIPRVRPHVRAATQPRAKRRSILRARVRALLRWRNLVVLVAAIVGCGLFVQSLTLGEAAIGVYALAALVLRVPSRATFVLAMATLVGVVLLLATGGDSDLSDNFAVYTFLLLAAGTLSLGVEVRRDYA